MTLNITLANSWGIWQSSDYRLTDPNTGEPFDDPSNKCITIDCSDGNIHLIYSGIGRVYDVHISDWLRRMLRGELRTVDNTLILIREEATRQLGPIVRGKFDHCFSIGAYINGLPWVVVISNDNGHQGKLFKFNTWAKKIDDGPGFIITGDKHAVTAADINLLTKVSKKCPKRMADYRNLLAHINKRASRNSKLISPECFSRSMHPEDPKNPGEGEGGGAVYFSSKSAHWKIAPTLVSGVDFTADMQSLVNWVEKATKGDDDLPDLDKFQKEQERSQKSVTPDKRLIRPKK